MGVARWLDARLWCTRPRARLPPPGAASVRWSGWRGAARWVAGGAGGIPCITADACHHACHEPGGTSRGTEAGAVHGFLHGLRSGCLVYWHDSRLGCERSRVQFPEQPMSPSAAHCSPVHTRRAWLAMSRRLLRTVARARNRRHADPHVLHQTCSHNRDPCRKLRQLAAWSSGMILA